MNLSGHIRLHRRIQKNPVWTQLGPGVFKLFMYIVMEANWRPESFYDGRSEIVIDRGSFVTSLRKLSDSCGLTQKQVRDGLDHLSKIGIVSSQTIDTYGRAHHATLLTVLNYERYQKLPKEAGHAKDSVEDPAKDSAEDPAKDSAKEGTNGARRAHEGRANPDEVVEITANPCGINQAQESIKQPLKEEQIEQGNKGTIQPEIRNFEGSQSVRSALSAMPIKTPPKPIDLWNSSGIDSWEHGRWLLGAWRRHKKNRGKETFKSVAMLLMGRMGLDWGRVKVQHEKYCRYWERQEEGWKYCPMTLLEWIDNEMPDPPEEVSSRMPANSQGRPHRGLILGSGD